MRDKMVRQRKELLIFCGDWQLELREGQLAGCQHLDSKIAPI